MTRPVRTPARAAAVGALWLAVALLAGGPGLLLLAFSEGGLATAAAAALLLGGLLAVLVAVSCRPSRVGPSLVLCAAVVGLCLAAPVLLRLDGVIHLGGELVLGWGAAALAPLATIATRAAGRPPDRPVDARQRQRAGACCVGDHAG